ESGGAALLNVIPCNQVVMRRMHTLRHRLWQYPIAARTKQRSRVRCQIDFTIADDNSCHHVGRPVKPHNRVMLNDGCRGVAMKSNSGQTYAKNTEIAYQYIA